MNILKQIVCFSFFVFGYIQTLMAQSKLNYEWVIGGPDPFIASLHSDSLGFDRYFDTTATDFKYSLTHGGANICDTNGRVMLISNGYNVIDSNKNIVDGLDSVGGKDFMTYNLGMSPYCQYSLFLPFENNVYYFVNNSLSNSGLYYALNTLGADAVFDELMYCKLDMNANGGMGKCTQREVKLLELETLSKTQMMACRHANGRAWWLLKQARGQNRIFKFLFTQDSVCNYGVQTFAEPIFSSFDQGGQSMFSQQGDKFATTCTGTGQIFIANFNRCDGLLSKPKVYNLPTLSAHNPFDSTALDTFSEGLAFSPNGRFIYVYMYYNIQQLDLWDNDTNTQWTVVAGLDTTWDAFNSYSSSYLGPDNRLYIGNWGGITKEMSYFKKPDEKGVASEFCPRCFRFPSYGVFCPPNMPNYDLGEDSSVCWPVSNSEFLMLNDELMVYPNPSSTIFYIKNKQGKRKQFVNLLGEVLLTTTTDEMDIRQYAKGIYFIKCEGQTRKVIIE